MTPKKKPADQPIRWCARFDLDIPTAVAEQLLDHVHSLSPRSLADLEKPEVARDTPDEPGVYVLYKKSDLEGEFRAVYVGKATPSLRARLTRHANEFRGRVGIRLEEMGVVAVPVSANWSAFGPERVLISKLRAEWQNSGFGNNDPGRNRDGTKWKRGHFDVSYPINGAWKVEISPLGEAGIGSIFQAIKSQTPFLFRFDSGRDVSHLLDETKIEIEQRVISLDRLLERCIGALPGWHAAILPGYVVAYPGHQRYFGPCRLFRSGSDRWVAVEIGASEVA